MDQHNLEPEGPPVQLDDVALSDEPTVVSSNTAKAIDFFMRLFPVGRLAVAEIAPDDPGCRGETFTLPGDIRQLATWIDARQGQRNLYYTLNEPVPRERQKGKSGRLCRDDIETIRGLAVDLDPRQEIEAQPDGFFVERERLRQIMLGWRGDENGPTALVDSGGGIQGVFLLLEPLPVTADTSAAVEAQARALSRMFGGDAVHSLEHLFRMPFTINLPTPAKRAKGRREAETRSQIPDPQRRHTLDDLALIAPPITAVAKPIRRTDIDFALAWDVLGDPASLPTEIADRLAAARLSSRSLDRLLDAEPAPQGQRSDRDYAIAAACVEAGFTEPEEIAGIVAAFSPGKFEAEAAARGDARAESYLSATIRNAIARTQPVRPEDHFEVIADAESEQDVKALDDPIDLFGDEDLADLATPPEGSLPKVIEAFVRTVALEMGVPESFVAVPAIAALGGAIGNALRLYPREHSDSWSVPASFPTVIVAPPGRKKSPTIGAVLGPHRAIDRELRSKGARERSAWEARYRSARGKVVANAPPMPLQRQLLVDDATLEKQVRIHADNPRGIIRAPDELAAWLGSMGAYKRNGDGDRGTMLRLLDGGIVSLERVGGSVFAESALMGLIATTQPDKMRMLARDLGTDGMLQRLVFVVDDGVERTPLDAPSDRGAIFEYEQAVRGMFEIDASDGAVVRLSSDARDILSGTWAKVNALRRLPGASPAWEGHVAKWEGLIYRITLTFHAVETWSFFESVPTEPGFEVTASTAKRVSRFIAFLMRHAVRFYTEFYEPAEHSTEARNIAGHLLTRPDKLSVTPRDIEKVRRGLQNDRRLTLSAMRDLETAGWVSVAAADRSKDGPTKWTVNPKIHIRFAERAVRETAHRAKAREQVLAAMSARRELRDVR